MIDIRRLMAEEREEERQKELKWSKCDHANLYNEEGLFNHTQCPDCQIYPWMLSASRLCTMPGGCRAGKAPGPCKKPNGSFCT